MEGERRTGVRRRRARSTRVALLLTWLAGPAGLTLWLGQSTLTRR